MERLTERYKDSIANIVLIRECGDKLCEDICKDIECDCSKCELEKALEKLATYEDLEEQGLLVRLPCPIGTTVWDICGMDIRENVLSGIECGKDGKQFLWANHDEWLGELNDLVFLTHEEAEKKLEEMKNE